MNAWRMLIFRRRLKALWKARTLMRPLVFWWKFNFRIRKKRAANAVLIEYLTAGQDGQGLTSLFLPTFFP